MFQQVLSFAAILAGVALLYVIAAFLGSEDPGLKTTAWVAIGLLLVVAVIFQVRRRRSRQSLDDVLRSRRPAD